MTEDYQKGYENGFREGRKRTEQSESQHNNGWIKREFSKLIERKTLKKATSRYWDAEEEKELALLLRVKRILDTVN